MSSVTSTWQSPAPAVDVPASRVSVVRMRFHSIDALRGLVMVIMLLDHVRENWFLYVPVSDPVDALTTSPGLFFTRLTSTLCAPVFVALTGVGAYLYSVKHSRRETTAYLVNRYNGTLLKGE